MLKAYASDLILAVLLEDCLQETNAQLESGREVEQVRLK